MLLDVSDLRVEHDETQLLGLLLKVSVLAVLASQKGDELLPRDQPQHPPGQLMAPVLSMNEHDGPDALGVRRGVAELKAANCRMTIDSIEGKYIFCKDYASSCG